MLSAMGFSERERRCAVRVSFDLGHDKDEALGLAEVIIRESKKIREENKQELEKLLR